VPVGHWQAMLLLNCWEMRCSVWIRSHRRILTGMLFDTPTKFVILLEQ